MWPAGEFPHGVKCAAIFSTFAPTGFSIVSSCRSISSVGTKICGSKWIPWPANNPPRNMLPGRGALIWFGALAPGRHGCLSAQGIAKAVTAAHINPDDVTSGGTMSALSLAFGLEFADLYERDGLVKVDAAFLAYLAVSDGNLAARLSAARTTPDDPDDKAVAQLMVDVAPHVEDFVAALFAIEAEVRALAAAHEELAPLYACKRLFVQRRAAKQVKPDEAAAFDVAVIEANLEALLGGAVDERNFATAVMAWLNDEGSHGEALELALHFAA